MVQLSASFWKHQSRGSFLIFASQVGNKDMAETGEAETSMEIDSGVYDVDRRAIEAVCPCCQSNTQDFYLHIRFFDSCGRFHLMKKAFEATKVELNAEREKHEMEKKTAKEETETQALLVQSHEMGEMKLKGLLANAEYDLEEAKRELNIERAKHEKEMKTAKDETETQALLAKSSKLIIDSHKMVKSKLQGLLEEAKQELNAERERHEEEMKTAKKAADSQVLNFKRKEVELQELLDKAEKDLEEATRGKAAKAKKKKKDSFASSETDSEDSDEEGLRKKMKTNETKKQKKNLKLRAATQKKVKLLQKVYIKV